MMSASKARWHCIYLIIASFVFNSWILFIADINEYGVCDILPEYEFIYKIMNTVETVFCMGLPSSVILISNLLVVFRLRAHLKRIPSSPTVSFNTTELVMNSALGTKPSNSRVSLVKINHAQSLSVDGQEKRKKFLRYTDIQLTRSLLVVTWAFIVLNLPNYIYRIIAKVLVVDTQTLAMRQMSLFVHTLLYTHHAILFYLYIFYSPQMKKRLLPTALKLLECYCLKPPLNDHS